MVQPNPVFPLADMFERRRDEFGYIAQSRNLGLRVVPTSALVYSDPRLLEQIIRNLLGNAIKYTEDGKILLGVRRCGDNLRIEVGDTGIGIAEDQLQAIFEEFHQVGNEARERSRGLGLGLSIVQRLGRLLKADGYIVRAAADAAAALQLVAHGAILPEILLTDYNLPGGINGLELVGKLRALLHADNPAIILTGDISTATLAKIAGEDCIQLSKPVNPDELTRALERLSPATNSAGPIATDSADLAASVTYIIVDDPVIRTALCEVLDGHGRTAHAFASA